MVPRFTAYFGKSTYEERMDYSATVSNEWLVFVQSVEAIFNSLFFFFSVQFSLNMLYFKIFLYMYMFKISHILYCQLIPGYDFAHTISNKNQVF